MVTYQIGHCPEFGCIGVAKSDDGICAIAMADDDISLATWLLSIYPHAQSAEQDKTLSKYLNAVLQYLDQPQAGLNVPLDVQGTAFQRRVWQALQTIPFGEKRSYHDLAQMIGRPGSVRAVASACASNLLALAIPCHRVIKKDGSLSGYRWGIKRKQWLIEKEAAALTSS